ncbi:hypothetical protein [Streptomyces mirabilis]|uniref:hypothetical protein n=1 Tax=Streptomyces mirabilis TaxID=68239 RepID=UPI0036DE5C46
MEYQRALIKTALTDHTAIDRWLGRRRGRGRRDASRNCWPRHDTQILGAAVEAGIDTSAWEERREKTRTYTRNAYSYRRPLSGRSSPA